MAAKKEKEKKTSPAITRSQDTGPVPVPGIGKTEDMTRPCYK